MFTLSDGHQLGQRERISQDWLAVGWGRLATSWTSLTDINRPSADDLPTCDQGCQHPHLCFRVSNLFLTFI